MRLHDLWQGEGFVSVELLFLPSTYAPCPECGGSRCNPRTLEVTYRGRTIAQVLDLAVGAAEFFAVAAATPCTSSTSPRPASTRPAWRC